MPIGDSCMRYRDGNLTFIDSSAGNYWCIMGMLMANAGHDMHAICIFYHFMKHEAMYANLWYENEAHKLKHENCGIPLQTRGFKMSHQFKNWKQSQPQMFEKEMSSTLKFGKSLLSP